VAYSRVVILFLGLEASFLWARFQELKIGVFSFNLIIFLKVIGPKLLVLLFLTGI
jgi:hypothetical protein